MTMTYRGYHAGPIEFDEDALLFHGEVLGLQDVITFQARDAAGLKQAFEDSVDDYLAFCGELGRPPERSYSGAFNVRLDPSVHRKVALAAGRAHRPMNAWIAETLEQRADSDLAES